MGRDIDIPNERPAPARQEERAPEEASRARHAIEGRGYVCRISDSELETLRDIGTFRTIAIADLAQQRYHGNTAQMADDLRSLKDQNLIQRRTLWTGGQAEKLTVVTLSKSGEKALRDHGRFDSAQAVYAGFVKPAEIAHDAAIYRMYHAEAQKIEQGGGRIRRIVLDYELKKNVYAPLAKARALPRGEYARKQSEIAGQNGLKVIGGKILLPDLRIEYEASDGGLTHVDLELATHHYRGSMMRGKAEAGFKMYAPAGSSVHRTAAHDPGFAAQIFSF
jgi:hypothetical protein